MPDADHQHSLLSQGGELVAKIGEYALSVICVVMLIGIASTLSPNAGMIKPVGGLILLVVMLQPLIRFDLGSLEMYLDQTLADGTVAAEQGRALTEKAMGERIKTETEAYILDKASIYGAEIHVDVELSEDEIPCPVGVTINGVYDAAIQRDLQNMIEAELGITKERQKWNGQY